MAKYIHVIYGDPRHLPYLSSIGSTWQNEKRIVPRKRENNPKHPLEDEVSKPTDPNSKATETPTQNKVLIIWGFPSGSVSPPGSPIAFSIKVELSL
jgi:hypothetical protein